jgi:hypothetical protein
MTLIADFLLVAGTFGAAIYCLILSARLKKFSTLESGMGGAIAVLSAQVDDMTRALETARGAATDSATRLDDLTRRAEQASTRLELLVASMHDLHAEEDDPAGSHASVSQLETDQRKRFVRRRVAKADLEAAE